MKEENNSPKLTILSEVLLDNSLIKKTPSSVFSNLFNIFFIEVLTGDKVVF